MGWIQTFIVFAVRAFWGSVAKMCVRAVTFWGGQTLLLRTFCESACDNMLYPDFIFFRVWKMREKAHI